MSTDATPAHREPMRAADIRKREEERYSHPQKMTAADRRRWDKIKHLHGKGEKAMSTGTGVKRSTVRRLLLIIRANNAAQAATTPKP